MLALLCLFLLSPVNIHCVTHEPVGSMCVITQRDKGMHNLKVFGKKNNNLLPASGVDFSGGGQWSFTSREPVERIKLDGKPQKFQSNPSK